MYTYTDFDKQMIRQRAAQFRDQLGRWQSGLLSEDEFRPLRLQNGWYVQRHAPMLRVAVPYGELSSKQLRQLAHIGLSYDRGYAHVTTRLNVQFNWIPLDQAADVMDLLADVNMHGIQTSGNCIRNISTDAYAGISVDEAVDPRPYCELLRQWSTMEPEFTFLPRKFKIAVTGAAEDRVALRWYDVGLQLLRNAQGEVGFTVYAGGGMGRTPIIATQIRDFLPWHQVLNYLQAIVRVYNLHGRRDNMHKARIKMLVKTLGQQFIDDVEREYDAIITHEGGPHTIAQAELERVQAGFPATPPGLKAAGEEAGSVGVSTGPVTEAEAVAYQRWLERNVKSHRVAGLRAVNLSLKRVGQAPGDITSAQMLAAAELADAFSAGELRTTHEQNLVLPWVHEQDLPAVWRLAKKHGFAAPTIGLLTDMITCPGGDFCALANARSIPIAQALMERFEDLDELYDIGPLGLHISGCINSCGHHHSGHIGILGVDKDGQEWYQISVGGSDGSELSGAPVPGKVIGPSFAGDEVTPAIGAMIMTYLGLREGREYFIDTLRRVGAQPFKDAANAVRQTTGAASAGKEEAYA